MLIKRQAERIMEHHLRSFPALVVTGSRQVGKTTLIRSMRPGWPYYDLDSADTLAAVSEDPRGIIDGIRDGAVFDEAQRAPELFSYIKSAIDEDRFNAVTAAPGTETRQRRFILSGSQNLLLSESVSESLAGRAAYIELMPLTYGEVRASGLERGSAFEELLLGGYPHVRAGGVPADEFQAQFVSTYLERDVRQMRNVKDLRQFRSFMALVAGRIGQVTDFTSLSNDLGVSQRTVKDWTSLMEASYVMRVLPPYHANLGKRLVRTPKIYLVDTGVACGLLGITSAEEAERALFRGPLFENYVIEELRRRLYLVKSNARLFFYRDSNGAEVDVIIERGRKLIPVEIKAGSTFSSDFLRGIKHWTKLTGSTAPSFVVYNGRSMEAGGASVLNWAELDKVVEAATAPD